MNTSMGRTTIAAPGSTNNCKVMDRLICTGTVYTPPVVPSCTSAARSAIGDANTQIKRAGNEALQRISHPFDSQISDVDLSAILLGPCLALSVARGEVVSR